jgi:hypothetical protein
VDQQRVRGVGQAEGELLHRPQLAGGTGQPGLSEK